MVDQLTLGIRLHDEANFENYFLGDNEEVVTTLKNWVLAQGGNNIFIAGNKGVGKSHLLQACCQYASSHDLKSFYLPIGIDLSPSILENLDNFSIVCIDNAEKIAGNIDWEEATFHLFNRALAGGAHLLLAGERLPLQLDFLLPDLSSRLASGITFLLKPLTDNQKLKVLQLRAKIRGFELNNSAGRYLLNHYPRDMTALFEVLDLLDEASLQAQHKLTIPFIKSVLSNFSYR